MKKIKVNGQDVYQFTKKDLENLGTKMPKGKDMVQTYLVAIDDLNLWLRLPHLKHLKPKPAFDPNLQNQEDAEGDKG